MTDPRIERAREYLAGIYSPSSAVVSDLLAVIAERDADLDAAAYRAGVSQSRLGQAERERDEARAEAGRLRDEVERLRAELEEAEERALRAEDQAKRDEATTVSGFLDEITEREPWRVLRAAAKMDEVAGDDAARLYSLADRLERERAEESKRDQLIEKARRAFKAESGIDTTPVDGWVEAVVDAVLAEAVDQ